MAEYLIQGSTLTSINDAIRNCLGENTWAINPDYVENASEGLLSPGAVEAIYAEYIDADNGVENKGDYISQKDIFIAYEFDINDNDEIVPYLYKTDRAGYEQEDEEFMEPDWGDPFAYIDTVQLDDGAIYDKWLKIDGEGASGWGEGQPKIYMYTEPIVIRNTFSPLEAPEKIHNIRNVAYSDGYDDGYSEGRIDGRDDGYAVGFETAVIDYAPMIIHGTQGAEPLAPSVFVNVPITTDITYNYTDQLKITTTGGGSSPFLTIEVTNSNSALTCDVTVTCECLYSSPGAPEEKFVESATIPVPPLGASSTTFSIPAEIVPSYISWFREIVSLQWWNAKK